MSRRASLARYALVTLNWLSPDRRIERAQRDGRDATAPRPRRARVRAPARPAATMSASASRPSGSLTVKTLLIAGLILIGGGIFLGTSTEASDPAGMSHLRNARARQPRRRCVRSEAGRPAACVRFVLPVEPVR